MPELASAPYVIKICGLTSLDDARMVCESGATALGLILTQSRRQVSVERAADIAQFAKGQLLRVGVVRDVDVSIASVLEEVELDAVQVHGPLDEALLELFRGSRLNVIKALAIGTQEFETFDETSVDAILVDGPTPGSGESHSWDELRERPFQRPVIAAGGLNPANVADVIQTLGVWGVDVATGVESSPGVKDLSRVLQFVREAVRCLDQGGLRP